MRGEWRATELTINGVALDLVSTAGRIDWPAVFAAQFRFGLTVDRLNLTGRVALHDAASRSTLELSDIAFSGDVAVRWEPPSVATAISSCRPMRAIRSEYPQAKAVTATA